MGGRRARLRIRCWRRAARSLARCRDRQHGSRDLHARLTDRGAWCCRYLATLPQPRKYRYLGKSAASSDSRSTELSFTPDSLRPPTYFTGELHRRLPFREAISALHDVVISDQRFKPRDLTQYRAWLAEQEPVWLADIIQRRDQLNSEVDSVRSRLKDLNRHSSEILKPYWDAQRRYFAYLYFNDRDTWYVLDPVISVHPDELFFECFSDDESSYAKLSCSYNVFTNLLSTEAPRAAYELDGQR